VMQRNCHEFIAYENLVGSRRSQDRGQKSSQVPAQQASLDQVIPLVRRALKVLTDREVTPQLGLLKSTLLQLDSTFSERTYGAGSFRDFAQKLAAAGHVVLRESGRNVLVELSENGHGSTEETVRSAQPPQEPGFRETASAPVNGGARAADGIRELRRLLQTAQRPPRWPMYIRQLKQYLRAIDPTFDERKFGFETLGDLMRACQREGLLRIERDRQGGMRIFPGNLTQPSPEATIVPPMPDEQPSVEAAESGEAVSDAWVPPMEVAQEQEVVEGAVLQELEVPPVVDAEEASAEKPTRRRSRAAKAPRSAGEGRAARKSGESATARPRRSASRPRAGRSRARSDAPTE
jgi:hypothetical protein